jgi:hypothetical protein
VFIGSNIAGVEFLGRYYTFRLLYRKLVASYILDALETADDKSKEFSFPSSNSIIDFLAQATGIAMDKRKSISLGWDIRFESENVVGAGLEFEEQMERLPVPRWLFSSGPYPVSSHI